MKKLLRRIKFRTWVALGVIPIILPVVVLNLLRAQNSQAAWYDTSYSYRTPISVNNSASAGSLTSFPVLVKLESTNFDFTKVQSTGADIRFTDSDGVTLLDYDIEKWDATNKVAYLWVEIPTLTNSSSYQIFIYYGNASASTAANSDNTWNSEYTLVQHLDETSGTHVDSTANNNDSTGVTVSTQGGDIGKVDGADQFDGTDDIITVADANPLDLGSTGTIEAWVQPDVTTSAISSFDTTWTTLTDAGDVSGASVLDTTDFTIVDGKIYYAASYNDNEVAVDATTCEFYTANSDLDETNLSAWTDQTDPAALGTGSNCNIAIDSDGTSLYYAHLLTSGANEQFETASSNLDGSGFSGWTNQTDPNGCANGVGCDLDMVVVGSKMYYVVSLVSSTTNGTLTVHTANSNLDGTSMSGWTSQTVPQTYLDKDSANISIDSDGEYLYYFLTVIPDFGTAQVSDNFFARSDLDGTDLTSWKAIARTFTTSNSTNTFPNMTLVGDKIYYVNYEDSSADVYTASSNKDGSNFSGWTISDSNETSGVGGGENTNITITTDGKQLYYLMYGHSNATTLLKVTRSNVTNRPIISKLNAYELIHSGGGLIFDWSGSPKSFGSISTTTPTHIAISQDGTTMNYYINGVLVRTQPTTTDFASNANGFKIGAEVGFYDGMIDEVRISSSGRSADWLEATYLSANNEMTKLGSPQEQKDPLGYWQMDEGANNLCPGGTNDACDSTNNKNDLALTGATWPSSTNCMFDDCLSFDGDGDFVTTTTDDNDFDFVAADSFTIQTWFRHSTASALQVMVAKTNASAGYKLQMEDDGDITCGIDDNGTSFPNESVTSTAATYDDDAWHLASCVKSGTSSLRLYIDGNEVGTADTSISTGSLANSAALYIGIDGDGAANDYAGYLDEAKIYGYARSQSEIYTDYARGESRRGASAVLGVGTGSSIFSSLVTYFKLDELNGTTANNTVSASANGTLSNIASPATATSGWTRTGKVNNAVVFDGSNDAVTIATANDAAVDFTGSETFSASAWVYVTTMPGSGEQDAIITKWDATSSQRGYRLFVENDDADTTGNFQVDIYDESLDQTILATTANDFVNTNTWYHVAFTFNGGTAGSASDLNLYVDGRLNNSNSANGSFAGLENVTSDFTVGDYDTTDATATLTALTGTIDEVKVYGTTLTLAQVRVDMNNGGAVNFSSQNVESDQLTDGTGNPPVGYWMLDANTGTSALDRSGRGNNGTLVNTARWVNGKIGQAVYFDGDTTGNDTHIRLPNDSLDGYTEGTIEAWIKPDDAGNTFQNILDYGDTGANKFEFGFNTANQIELWTNGCDTGSIRGTASIPGTVTDWHHVVLTVSASGNALYIDGLPVTVTYTGGNAATTCFYDDIDEGTSFGTIGCTAQNGSACLSTEVFQGVIDEVKVYDYARTYAQIRYDYNRGRPLAWWKFDECSGTNANDAAGNSFTGTITPTSTGNTAAGTCGSGTNTQMWNNGTSGKLQASLDFDGADDYVQIADAAALRFDAATQDFSLFAWVKRASNGEMNIISKEDADNDGWRLQFTSGNAVRCSVDAIDIDSTLTITDTNWHHVGCIIDRDGNGQVYIDGNANGSATAISSEVMANTSNIKIGVQSFTTLQEYFDGQIDDVRIYNYALSRDQIRKVMINDSIVRFGPSEGISN